MQIDRSVSVLVLSSVEETFGSHGKPGFFEAFSNDTIFRTFVEFAFSAWEFREACQSLTLLTGSNEVSPGEFDNRNPDLLDGPFGHSEKSSAIWSATAERPRHLRANSHCRKFRGKSGSDTGMFNDLAGFAVRRPTD